MGHGLGRKDVPVEVLRKLGWDIERVSAKMFDFAHELAEDVGAHARRRTERRAIREQAPMTENYVVSLPFSLPNGKAIDVPQKRRSTQPRLGFPQNCE